MNQEIEINRIIEETENRHCSCSSCECNNASRREMLEQIKAYNFAVIELGLYLDTNPNDERALCLHNNYTKTLKELKDKYQKVYGPLSIYYPCNKWRWLEEPWPWEGGIN